MIIFQSNLLLFYIFVSYCVRNTVPFEDNFCKNILKVIQFTLDMTPKFPMEFWSVDCTGHSMIVTIDSKRYKSTSVKCALYRLYVESHMDWHDLMGKWDHEIHMSKCWSKCWT